MIANETLSRTNYKPRYSYTIPGILTCNSMETSRALHVQYTRIEGETQTSNISTQKQVYQIHVVTKSASHCTHVLNYLTHRGSLLMTMRSMSSPMAASQPCPSPEEPSVRSRTQRTAARLITESSESTITASGAHSCTIQRVHIVTGECASSGTS